MTLRLYPVTLKQAKEFVGREHRHHAPPVGHKFSIGVMDEFNVLRGVVVVSRPVARGVDYTQVAEVARLATDGAKNACSMLYGAAARCAKEMGYYKIQTYILEKEPGTSLKAAGWHFETTTAGGDWNSSSFKNRRKDQPQGPKQRWAKVLRERV